jgi:MATE family multidrug resistance protein
MATTAASSLFPQTRSSNDGALGERTSLLSKPCPSRLQAQLQEFLLLLRMSVPVILAYTLQNSLQTISVLVVGRLSASHLAAAAFSYMFAMCSAWLIALGGTTALDTLCSSTFTGSKNPHELGILLQRAFLVLGGMYLPISLLWWFSEPVFLALGQSPEISHDSAVFLRALIPGGLGYIFFEAMKKFLQAQGIMSAGTYVLLFTSPLSAALNYVFVYTFDWGLVGAPLATGLTYWVSFAGLVAYARFVKGGECWGGWDRACFNNVGTFARLAALGVVMVGTEWVPSPLRSHSRAC